MNETTTITSFIDSPSRIDFIQGVFYTYIVPSICAFGMFTNILNIIVFNDKDMKDETFKYLRMNAFSNFFYLLFVFFVFSKRCGDLCSLNDTYFTQVYYWVFYVYAKGKILFNFIFVLINLIGVI